MSFHRALTDGFPSSIGMLSSRPDTDMHESDCAPSRGTFCIPIATLPNDRRAENSPALQRSVARDLPFYLGCAGLLNPDVDWLEALGESDAGPDCRVASGKLDAASHMATASPMAAAAYQILKRLRFGRVPPPHGDHQQPISNRLAASGRNRLLDSKTVN